MDDASEVGIPANTVEGSARTFTRNSAISVGRLLLSTAIAFLLPTYLTHKLPVKTYSAWVLILQMSAYVSYLDFGVQTGIAKFVAEYDARNDADGASTRASAGLAIILVASLLGVLLTLILAWRVPDLFSGMPSYLYGDVRLSLIFVGVSLSFNLLFSIFAAIFLGLQRFGVPMVISLVNRLLFTAAVMAAVYLHSSLAMMGALVAFVNILTGVLQLVAWRRLSSSIRLSLRGLDPLIVKKMLLYCSSLAIWTLGMLCVSGLDVTIVGRYDFSETAFYSIAILPTNFMVSVLGAAAGPLLTTASALSVHRSPTQMGTLLARATRYSSILLMLLGLPLMVGGYWILRLWVGPVYAAHTIGYLRILLLANMVRSACLPYSSMLVATDSQKVAIFGASSEALVNVASSIYFVQHMGAIGVAYGTLLGAVVSVGMHFAVSMHFTYPKLAVSRARLLLSGLVRPLTIALPSLILASRWWSTAAPLFSFQMWSIWVVSSLLLGWLLTLDTEERDLLMRGTRARLGLYTRYN